jgi:hypothetical protein
MKSRVTKTLMSDLAVEKGFVRKTTAPMMNSWLPWHNALKDMVRPVTHINPDVVKCCAESFLNDIMSKLTPEDYRELQVYDNMTAINGRPGLAYVDKLNRNTSAGFPFSKSKKFFLESMEPVDDWQHPVSVTADVLGEMNKIIETYESGKIYCPIFTASLKDEPVSLKKAKIGKTRVFCGAPMPWSIVVRKYYLSMIRFIQKRRYLFESGPGTIAQSKEWDDMYKYLVHHGTDRIVAGDYEKFDKRMPMIIIAYAFWIMIELFKKADWSVRDIKTATGISEDCQSCWVDFYGDFIRLYGTNPSGNPLTVIINGLANALYMRYCYFMNNPEGECSSFKDNVNLMTYGDDMIMGVSPDCDWFNHTNIQRTLADIDIGFTMADKDAPSIPFIDIKDATFLRRSWRFEPELDCMVCPIEHDSIDKMMTMCVESKTISKELQAIAVLNSAIREYFWYGYEIFQLKRKIFYEIIEELELIPYMDAELPTWDQLKGEFLFNSNLRQ